MEFRNHPGQRGGARSLIPEPLYRAGRSNNRAAGNREVPRCAASHHLRQRSAVHREGLQRVHPPGRNDLRENLAVLPAKQRQNRAVARNVENRTHAPGHAAFARRRPADRGAVSRAPKTPCACSVPSTTSPRMTSCKAAPNRFCRPATPSSPPHASSGAASGNRFARTCS